MQNFINKKVLITTDRWFIAPDGKQYRSVWGELKAIHEAGKTLGFIPNRSHANWFIEIGEMVIMGCQVMYVLGCPEKPHTGATEDYSFDAANGCKEYSRPSFIYISE